MTSQHATIIALPNTWSDGDDQNWPTEGTDGYRARKADDKLYETKIAEQYVKHKGTYVPGK